MIGMTHKFRFLSELILGGGLVCYSVLAIIGFILFPNNEPKLQTSLQAAYVLVAAALILGVALIYRGIRDARGGAENEE